MSRRVSRSWLHILPLGSLLLLGTASVSLAASVTVAPRFLLSGSVYRIERGRVTYTYDAIWRLERVQVLDPASGRIADSADPALKDGLRAALLRRLHVPALNRIPAEGTVELESLKALGYL